MNARGYTPGVAGKSAQRIEKEGDEATLLAEERKRVPQVKDLRRRNARKSCRFGTNAGRKRRMAGVWERRGEGLEERIEGSTRNGSTE